MGDAFDERRETRPDASPDSPTPASPPGILVAEERVDALRARLDSADAAARPPQLVTLAWHLRMRDPARAAALADEADALLAHAGAPADAPRARLALVRAEAHLLRAEFEAARERVRAAVAGFERAADAAGLCDAHWLDAGIAADLGRHDARDASYARAREFALAGGDPLRVDLVDSAVAYQAVFVEGAAAERRWAGAMQAQLATGDPARAIWSNDFRVAFAFSQGEHGRAIPWLREQLAATQRVGHRRKAISTAANLGMAWSMLNDHEAALEWALRALAMARAAGWPASIGTALMQTAATLAKLEQPAAAQTMLDEAIELLAPLTGAYVFLPALGFQGDFALQRGDAGAALRAFAALEERALALSQKLFLSTVQLGRARALALEGEAQAAVASALDALGRAVDDGEVHLQVDALEVLAELHARFALAPPAGVAAADAALHYIDRALAVAAAIPGFTTPDRLLARAAAQHAAVGRHARAYEIALQAAAAREATHGREVRNRAMALELRHAAERAQAESEHLRELTAAEARRVQALEATLAELRTAQAELVQHSEEQARMGAERDETLAFMAHDLRAPLVAIVTLLPQAPADPMLASTVRFATRALAMTDRFLDAARLSRLAAVARAPLDLAAVADDACETFARRAVLEGKQLESELVFGIAVAGHREALTRAFCNLVDNALKAIAAGGRVDVSMRATDAHVEVAISDDGPGMPPAAQQALRDGASGAGRMGLAIVAEVARMHEARIELAVSPQGTRVGLVFDRAA